MSAKSARQLLYAPGRALRFRRALVIVALVLFSAGAAWLVDAREVEARRVASLAQQHAAPVQEVAAPPAASVQVESPREESHQHALSEFLAHRYKVSQAVTLDLVTIAHAAGQQIGLDPLLIIAVMAVESRFNPIAESVAGAKGLMQVIPKYHIAKFREFGRDKSVFDPETNILVGSQILKEYLSRTGNLNAALQMYVGASSDEKDAYTGKVMNEKQRLQQVLRKSVHRPDVEAASDTRRIAMIALQR
jgi:soluble lytic murein transglycosylase-like protein